MPELNQVATNASTENRRKQIMQLSEKIKLLNRLALSEYNIEHELIKGLALLESDISHYCSIGIIDGTNL
jgi:hypothetical protein